jgi:hypothetical protein
MDWILTEISVRSLTGCTGTVHTRTGHEGPEGEYMYSSSLSLTPVLNGVGGQRHASAVLPPGKTRYPLCRRLDGSQSRSGRVRLISPPLGFDPRTVQPVTKRRKVMIFQKYVICVASEHLDRNLTPRIVWK